MRKPPIQGFGPNILTQRLSRIALRRLSNEQVIELCTHSTQELEELALDAEVQTAADVVIKRQRFLDKNPDIRNPEEIS